MRRLDEGMKRAFDVAVAGAALVVLSPLMAGIAGLVRGSLGSPVFFTQERPGLHGKPFTILKFRTMKDAVDRTGQPLPDADRLTRFGRFLRATSMDELPELWNVLRGDMSIVGPRPLLMEYLPRYSARQARRHDVRPGITGWAQVNGRNALRWEDKFAMDIWYVEHQSLALDIKIIALTVWKVLRSDGISAAGEATMPRFMGAPSEERTPLPGVEPS
jgi:lipopolysaccharide/colanic/teichoic acid biosynthesis glycosyltransferase